MLKHPDADAFVRAHLAHPADTTARLVLADWLEETGAAHSAAWARYIRLQIEAERHGPDSLERGKLTRQAEEYAPQIRAKLTIAAKTFIASARSLLELLPARNLVVRLRGFEVARPVLDLVPLSVARENLILPLHLQGRTLLVAAADPHNSDTARTLEFILNRAIVAVGADDIDTALDRHYDVWNVENVDSSPVFTEFADDGWESAIERGTFDPISSDSQAVARLVNRILREAIDLRADRILLFPDLDATGLRFRIDGEWVGRERPPIRLLHPITNWLALRAALNTPAAVAGPLSAVPRTGVFPLDPSGVLVGVTILPSPDGPTTQLDILLQPAE
jgi:uncharacterized protein (TIGR02996 family)